jgi:antirestriction protein ArdC
VPKHFLDACYPDLADRQRLQRSAALNLRSKGKQVMEKLDLYTRITNRIVAELEKGCRPWLKPWNAEHAAGRITRPLRHNGTPYRGINILNLWIAATASGYVCPIWLTYKQSQEIGAQVRKGEKGELVVFASKISRTEATETGEEIARDISFLKGYTVFNAEQIDGLPSHFTAPAAPTLNPVERIERAEAYFKATGAVIKHGGDRAFYAPGPDRIQMPPFEAFRDAESFYGTLAHEAVHWSGAKSRLDRNLSGRFGTQAYAAEELIAELGSAFLSADLGLTPEPRADHASYIETWLHVLKADKRAIFTAAAHAERAAAFLHGLQPKAEAPDEPNAESITVE